MPAAEDRAFSSVILDFGGVISRPQRPEFHDEVGRRLGVEREVLQAAYRRHRSGYDRGTLDGRAYWRAVLADLGSADGPARLDELIRLDTESWTVIDREVVGEIEALRRGGARLAILSNMPWDIGRHIRAHHDSLMRLFDVVTFSCEIGLIKPEAGIYAHTLRRLGVRAEDALFVDDTAANVEAARRLGMTALLFRSTADLRRLPRA